MKERKMCDGCMACNPEDYTIEVTADFLHHMLQRLGSLEEHLPKHTTPYSMDIVWGYVEQIQKKYSQSMFILDESFGSRHIVDGKLVPYKSK